MKGKRGASGFVRESLYNAIAILLAVVLPAVLVIRTWNAEVEKAEDAPAAPTPSSAPRARGC